MYNYVWPCDIQYYREDFAAAKKGIEGNWGYIDRNENFVIKPQFDEAEPFSEGLAAVEIDWYWGYIDKVGNVVIEPKYDWVKPFSEGMAAVRIRGDWGYINTKGKMIIKPKYEAAGAFNNGVAKVEKYNYDTYDYEYIYIDKNGKRVK